MMIAECLSLFLFKNEQMLMFLELERSVIKEAKHIRKKKTETRVFVRGSCCIALVKYNGFRRNEFVSTVNSLLFDWLLSTFMIGNIKHRNENFALSN